MDFLKKLFGGGAARKAEKRYYTFQVKCKRCGEIIEGRVDLDNDLSVEYQDGGDVFFVHKVLMGDGRQYCYQKVDVELKFDAGRKLLDRRIESGGDFVK